MFSPNPTTMVPRSVRTSQSYPDNRARSVALSPKGRCSSTPRSAISPLCLRAILAMSSSQIRTRTPSLSSTAFWNSKISCSISVGSNCGSSSIDNAGRPGVGVGHGMRVGLDVGVTIARRVGVAVGAGLAVAAGTTVAVVWGVDVGCGV